MKVDEELKGFVRAVSAATPEPPLMVRKPRKRRTPTPVLAMAGGFAVVMLVVGLASVLLTGGSQTDQPVGSAPSSQEPSPQHEGPPPTFAPSDVVYDSETAVAFRLIVDDSLESAGVGVTVTSAYSSHADLNDGGSVTAVVRDELDGLLLIVDYQAFTAQDADWEDQLSESATEEELEDGKYLENVSGDPPLPIAFHLSDWAAVTVKVESASMAALLPDTSLRALTLQIAREANSLSR